MGEYYTYLLHIHTHTHAYIYTTVTWTFLYNIYILRIVIQINLGYFKQFNISITYLLNN